MLEGFVVIYSECAGPKARQDAGYRGLLKPAGRRRDGFADEDSWRMLAEDGGGRSVYCKGCKMENAKLVI